MKTFFSPWGGGSIAASALALLLPLLALSCGKPNDSAQPAGVEHYTCPMHPSVKMPNPTDKCPICSMALVAVPAKSAAAAPKGAPAEHYTCAMHPSVKMNNPKDKCPICSMDLVPVKKRESAATHDGGHGAHTGGAPGAPADPEGPSSFVVSPERQQQIGVTYAEVEQKPLRLQLRTVGLVAYDKLRHWDIVTRVEGYVDRLFVASNGETVEEAQPLVTIYSPELLTTQQELLDLLKARDRTQPPAQAASGEGLDALIESAKVRMRLWNLTDGQIEELVRTRQPQVHVTIHSPVSGLVSDIQVDQGRKVMPGDHLVDVTDLSVVWVWAEFYQEELPLLEAGLPVGITTSAYPDAEFRGHIAVVDPFVNEAKRVIRVRVDVQNVDLKLRPDMFVDLELHREMGEGLTVPFQAVLPTGRRNIVFVDRGGGRLEPRYVDLGRKYGQEYEVRGGLQEGERVVASGNFLIDAEAKVQGALSGW